MSALFLLVLFPFDDFTEVRSSFGGSPLSPSGVAGRSSFYKAASCMNSVASCPTTWFRYGESK
jgi:hypothetical protein